MRHCQALTVASRALQTLAWGHGVAREKVVYVPNGAGIGEMGIADWGLEIEDRGMTLLLYSRLFEFEVGRLVQILVQVKRVLPALRILSVGAGLYEGDTSQFRAQLQTAGLLQSFEDVGWVAEGELPALLGRANAGLYLMEDNLLNRTKCPVKLADMVACGLPLVAEAVGQVPEYVRHGHNGLLRQSGDNAGIAQDLITLLSNSQLRHQFAANAHTHYQTHFAWEIQGRRLAALYQTL